MTMLDLTTLNIVGPFWSAEVEVVTLDWPQRNLALRRLFLDITPRKVAGKNGVLVPGSLLALCLVRRVLISPRAGTTFEWKRSPNAPVPPLATFDAMRAAVRAGAVSLLLLEADPTKWSDRVGSKPPPFTCLAGDIALDALIPQGDAVKRLYAALTLTQPVASTIRSPGMLSVHASGLSILGGMTLPWYPNRVTALFQLVRVVPPPGAEAPAFQLTIETDRLTEAERVELIRATQRLSSMINPRHPLNQPPQPDAPTPRWVTLELTNPASPPRVIWPIPTWGTVGKLRFPRGEINLLLSDLPPYDADLPPVSMARVIPDEVIIDSPAGGTLVVTVRAGVEQGSYPEQPPDSLNYDYQAGDHERIQLRDIMTAFSPIETPRLLRIAQDLPVPVWDDDDKLPLAQPVVWGFVPLDDGWAQLPIPNLTEQIYLDAGLAQTGDEQAIGNETDTPGNNNSRGIIQGAVSFTNRQIDSSMSDPAEHPWAVTIINTPGLSGTWTLKNETLTTIDLTVLQPDLVLNGFFWLSTARPTDADALPNFDNWISGLRSVPLERVHRRVVDNKIVAADLFPALVVLRLRDLAFSATPASGSAVPRAALLESWSLAFDIDNPLLALLTPQGSPVFLPLAERLFTDDAPVLPRDLFTRHAALAWRRHPVLPTVQALPLTQAKQPPNEPIASRQFAPFALPTHTRAGLAVAVPDSWHFGVTIAANGLASGALTWPHWQSPPTLQPALEWRSLPDLPLAVLSLPGLQFDPSLFSPPSGLASSWLPLQYRYDLPYTDEVQALAQIPKQRRPADSVSPFPEEPPPVPPRPLIRETYAQHWRRLSEMASLAAADAVAAFGTEGEQQVVRGLVEPFVWLVEPTITLEPYPGNLAIAEPGAGGGLALELSSNVEAADSAGSLTAGASNAALRGFSSLFARHDGAIRLARPSDTMPLIVEAGSLAAHPNGDGTFRDQRGLSRAATTETGALLRTIVHLDAPAHNGGPDVVALTSTRMALSLEIDRTHHWQLWFRDLPIRAGSFLRDKTASPAAEDVNDPEALAREFNYLNGYEWRLADATTLAKAPPVLALCGLEFFPLKLTQLDVSDDQVQLVQLVGRLQLPLSAEPIEISDLSNAVQATFVRIAGQLTLDSLQLLAGGGEWPLALTKGEIGDAPRIVWAGVHYDRASHTLELTGAHLCFHLFGTEWRVPLPSATTRFSADIDDKPRQVDIPPIEGALVPTNVTFTLDLAQAAAGAGEVAHSVTLDLALRLGRAYHMPGAAKRSAFTATVRFAVLDPESAPAKVLSAQLFDDIVLHADVAGSIPPDLVAGDRTFQFTWERCQQVPQGLQILPGMPLLGNDVPGCAVLTFEPAPADSGIPRLGVQLAFVEAVLYAQWGHFLQTDTLPSANLRERVYSSSAGDLVLGYTAHALEQVNTITWEEEFLLNGVLEIKSLISWPTEMHFDRERGMLTLPPVAQNPTVGPLNHIRHTMRMLFNQHRLPTELLVLVEGPVLLFDLSPNHPWQPLIVVEHQLIDVYEEPQSDGEPAVRLGADRRWTVVQEVRLMAPVVLRNFLHTYGGETLSSLDPATGLAPLTEAGEGYFAPEVRAALLDEIDRRAAHGPYLLVEASSPHWLRPTPLRDMQMTALQYLPGGSQHAILSHPDDYTGDALLTQDSGWLLLTTPFLGRLQPLATDSLAATDKAALAGPLAVDPVLALRRALTQSPRPPHTSLAFALTHRGDTRSVVARLAHLDTASGHLWTRLDTLTLDENLLRLHTPFPEPFPERLASIIAALPDTPARASRSVALRRAFDVFRPFVPPADVREFRLPGDNLFRYQLPPEIVETELVWRQRSLLAPSSVGDVRLSAGQRVLDGLQALYTFAEGGGNLIKDRSDVGAPLNLLIDEPDKVRWLAGGGLVIDAPVLIASNGPATKIINSCRTTNQITIEVWIKPTRLHPPSSHLPARIVSISEHISKRNISLQQGEAGQRDAAFYHARVRTKRGDNEGNPAVITDDNTLKLERTHVVYTFDASSQGRIYLNGSEQVRVAIGGNFSWWDKDYPLLLANELSKDRPWAGEYYLVAIYNRALTPAEVAENYAALPKPVPRAWHTTAALISSSGLVGDGSPDVTGTRRYPAATLLPARLTVDLAKDGSSVRVPNPQPLSFAVSPYLGLSFRMAPQQMRRVLVSAELLCVDPKTGSLLPVTNRFFEDGGAAEDAAVLNQAIGWAREMHRQLTPESPVALLRLREILALPDEVQAKPDEAAVITRFRFALVRELVLPPTLSRRVARLRTEVQHMRFREGQYGGSHIPNTVEPFELAPPQVTGVQPIYLTERPNARTSTGTDSPPSGVPPTEMVAWTWGLSGLRFSVRYTQDGQGIAGTPIHATGSASAAQPGFWWQAIQYTVQYRSGLRETPLFTLPASIGSTLQSGTVKPELRRAFEAYGLALAADSMVTQQPNTIWYVDDASSAVRYVVRRQDAALRVFQGAAPGAGLPPLFRATPIRSFLSVLPDPPMPPHALPPDAPHAALSPGWQPVLPGSLHYFVVGARSGVMLAVRNQLIRQSDHALTSGSLPVQHRVPRPVPLPPNHAGAEDSALQTWASYFEPEHSVLVSPDPVDETFYAATQTRGPLRLRLWLIDPARGILPAEWDGSLTFEATAEEQAMLPLTVTLLAADQSYVYTRAASTDDAEVPSAEKRLRLTFIPEQGETLKRQLAALGREAVILIQVKVEPNDAFRQTLTFALRLADSNALPLPLEPYTIHFEDPEYNRALATQAGVAQRLVKLTKNSSNELGLFTISLTTDRRSYNPFSALALRYDWDTPLLNTKLRLVFQRVTAKGVVEDLVSNMPSVEQADLTPGFLFSMSLTDLRVARTLGQATTEVGNRFGLHADDKLRIKLVPGDDLAGWDDYERPAVALIAQIDVDIVAEPVIPVPEAAYALLRRQFLGGQAQVECVRFAWCPNASRIDLISKDDLPLGIVRRRAVFQWHDVVRIGTVDGYAVQKIAYNGATNVPMEWERGDV
ncbi:MAG TPA: LamG domain-containing protein [Herpetosiphonaceae bacterium]